jgi:hypothetical protein
MRSFLATSIGRPAISVSSDENPKSLIQDRLHQRHRGTFRDEEDDDPCGSFPAEETKPTMWRFPADPAAMLVRLPK